MKPIAFGILVVTLGATASAHHSFSAEFDSTKPVKLTGTIAGMRWSNPHAWLYVEVKEAGETVRWSVEMVAANQLYRLGWRVEDAQVGAEVTIAGFRARNGTPTANATTMTLADGRALYSSNAPPARPTP